MKVAFKKGESVAVREATLRALNPGEIRLKVDACGVCGTDLHLHPGKPEKESGFGHEMAGTILEVGPQVSDLAAGQGVAIESSSACGRCSSCRNARQELCLNVQGFWSIDQYGFAEETIVPAISAVPYDNLSPEVACLSEPLGVAIDMVRLADIQVGANVLILGPGAIGLMALSLARRAGARRIFVSGHRRRAARMNLAMRLGADEFMDPTEGPIEEHKFGCAIDRILVTSPPRTLASAIGVAAKGAIISFIGIEYGDGALCTFDANHFHFKKLQLRASFASPALYTPLALQYLAEGVVDGEALISHRFPLQEIAKALQTARNDPSAVKVVVKP